MLGIISLLRNLFTLRASHRIHPHVARSKPPPDLMDTLDTSISVPISARTSKCQSAQSERLNDTLATGRSQLDVLARNHFGVGQRWTKQSVSFRADGSVRDDRYDDGLKRAVASAADLMQLSNEELEIAMRTFRKFDRDRDGKLLPEELLAFWKHIAFLTVADHAGSIREAGETTDEYIDGLDEEAFGDRTAVSTDGAMDLPEFIKVFQRFSAAEQTLMQGATAGDAEDLDYRMLLSQAACSLVVYDAISQLPGQQLQRAVELFRRADVKRRGSLRMTVAAARLGLARTSVGPECDLDKNNVLDFNEFVKSVFPKMESFEATSEAAPGESKNGRWGVAARWKTGKYASFRNMADEPVAEHGGAILDRVGGALAGDSFSELTAEDLDSAMRLFKKFDHDGDGILKPEEMSEFWRHVTNLSATDHYGSVREADERDFGPGDERVLLDNLQCDVGMDLTSFITVLERFSSAEKALVSRLDASRDDEYEYRVQLVASASSLCLFDAVSMLQADHLKRAVDAFKQADLNRRGSIRLTVAGEMLGVEMDPSDDADANGILDFNEFVRFVMPRIDAMLKRMKKLDGFSPAQQSRELRAIARRNQASVRASERASERASARSSQHASVHPLST